MNEKVREYIEKYPSGIVEMYDKLRKLVLDSAPSEPQETMWAKLPSYYIGESFVRLIPFKDHIIVEAKAVTEHMHDLSGYKITPKGMLQIIINQDIPTEVLQQVFIETFG